MGCSFPNLKVFSLVGMYIFTDSPVNLIVGDLMLVKVCWCWAVAGARKVASFFYIVSKFMSEFGH